MPFLQRLSSISASGYCDSGIIIWNAYNSLLFGIYIWNWTHTMRQLSPLWCNSQNAYNNALVPYCPIPEQCHFRNWMHSNHIFVGTCPDSVTLKILIPVFSCYFLIRFRTYSTKLSHNFSTTQNTIRNDFFAFFLCWIKWERGGKLQL